MGADGSGAARPFAVGASHRVSRAAVRDRLFMTEAELPAIFAALRAAGLQQAIVLSTCDRVEVQGAHADPAVAAEAVAALLAERAGQAPEAFRDQLSVALDGAAIRQIFAVAAALESQILGEPQVLGQVKAAHRRAQAAGLMGPELDTVLQAAYAAAKRVRTETAIGARPVTLASAAVQLARDVHGDLGRCAGLLVGGGDMGEPLIEHLRGAGLQRVAVCGPSPARADELARQLGCHSAPFEPLEETLAAADIAVTAAGTGRRIVTAEIAARSMRRRRNRPILIVDLGIPADVEAEVERIDGVFRYDLDDLERVALSGRADREAAAAEAWRIVEAELESFARSRAERAAVPAIAALRRQFEIARARALREAGDDAARATELLINRLLHAPSSALRRQAAEGRARDGDRSAERLLAELFELGEAGEAEDGT